MKRIFFIIFLMKLTIEAQAKVFNSIAAMEPIMNTQAQVIRSIETYITEQKKKIKFIENHISYNTKRLKKAESDPKFLWNPINAFSLMNSLYRDFIFIKNLTKEMTGYYQDKTLLYPCKDDLMKSSHAITHLQTVYQLNITQLANGMLVSNFSRNNELYVERVAPMTADDCYYLGLVPAHIQGFSGQLLWRREALRKFYAEKCDDYCRLKEVHIVMRIGESYESLKEYGRALKWMKRVKALLSEKDHRDLKDLEKHEKELQKKIDNGKGHKTRKQKKKAWEQPKSYDLFECNDLKPLTRKQNVLKCIYDWISPTISEVLRYAPLKVEYVSVRPKLIIYHDIISDAEIEALKNIAIPKLEDFSNYKNKQSSKKNHRTGMGALLDRSWPLVARLTQRIEDITNINTTDTKLQVVNYRVGDSFSRHVDYLGDFENNTRGGRFIAFTYFLSDVEQGGALSFPQLGLKIYPTKGAAVAWMVTYPSGEGDPTMVHAVCPVIRGSRWVAAHWSYHGNVDRCPIWHYEKELMTAENYSQWLQTHKEIEKQLNFEH